jgi:hypothetical protein
MVARAVISDKNQIDTVLIQNKNSYRSIISQPKGTVLINQVLPFRVRFTDIKIPGYGPNNVPGIGIQVIGYSNYIL